MKISLLTLIVLTILAGTVQAQSSDLFISEYIEGNGNNKALEIYNGTGDAVNLGDYAVTIYANGSTTAGQIINLDSVTLNVGDVFVLANSFGAPELLAAANQTSGNLTFNGDDAVLLEKSSQAVDSIGTIGLDPGYSWSCTQGNTQNQTLRRKGEVCDGDNNPFDSYDVCLEWEFFIVDDFSGLGQHANDCGSVANQNQKWCALKAIFR